MLRKKTTPAKLIVFGLLAMFSIFILFIFFIEFIDDSAGYANMKSKEAYSDNVGKSYYKLTVDIGYQPPPIDIIGENKRGSGLNLLLINNIKTEGYVKEMLELYRDSAMGRVSNNPYHMPLQYLLGIQTNETGTYPSTLIPKSYIPFESNTIKWNMPYSNLPSDALTLRLLNRNVINSINPTTKEQTSDSNLLPYTINGINPAVGKEGWEDVNVFQVRYTNFSMYGGKLPPSVMTGYNEKTVTRLSDPYYIPDNLAYIDEEASSMIAKYEVDSANHFLIAMMYSIQHNGGPAVLQSHATFGVPYKDMSSKLNSVSSFKSEYVTSLNEVAEDFREYGNDLSCEGKYYDTTRARVSGVLGLCYQGWSINQTAFNLLTSGAYSNVLETSYKAMFGADKTKEQAVEYLKSHISYLNMSTFDASNVYSLNNSEINGSEYGSVFIVRNRTSKVYKNKMSDGSDPKVVQFLNVINVGHVHSTLYSGGFTYGSMLKYAGVDIDPTNPESYLDPFRGTGEWLPSGETDWIKEYEIDTSVMTTEAIRTLNEGKQWLGSWYAWGGKTPPTKDKNGIWMKPKGTGRYDSGQEVMTPGFDCSGFTHYVMEKSFKIDIGYSTTGQMDSSYLRTITEKEAKPGDIVLIGNPVHHVGFFMKDLGNSILLMHSPQTGDVVKIGKYPKGAFTYKRYDGMYPR